MTVAMIAKSVPNIGTAQNGVVREVGREWIARSAELRFAFGEFTYHHSRFPALTLDLHNSEITADFEAGLPTRHLSRGTEALYLPSAPAAADFPKISLTRDYIRYVPEQFNHHWIEYSGTFEKYLKDLRSKARHEILRKMRRFKQRFGEQQSFQEFRHPEEMQTYHSLALEVSRKTYQDRILQVGMPDDAGFADTLTDYASTDRIRGYLLLDGEHPIAYAYCCAREPILFYVHTGYDPRYREWSPGLVMLYHILERFFSEGRFRVLDFGSGESQWKEYYSNTTARCARVYYFRKTLRNLSIVLAHRMATAASDSVVGMIDAIGLKQKVKRFFRSTRKPAATPND